MTPALAVILAIAAYVLAYRVYSRRLATKVFQLDPDRATPAHTQTDGVDYVPTAPPVLFGHHFASITGLAPMLGPAVAVIWGWVPALLWVVLGAIFIGCVHDMSALVLSVRHRGQSVGQVAASVVGARARALFLLIIGFGIALAMGVFVFVISRLFSVELAPGRPGYPYAVLPSILLIVVAMVSGWLMYRRGVKLLAIAIIGFALEIGGIALGLAFPTMGLAPSAWPSAGTWTLLLLGYAFAASVLPVWALLQSRDFLNSLLLYLGMGLAYVGLLVGGPSFDAPAFALQPEGAPSQVPFVFIIIACGAASGFHGLVSSGTTAKQLDRETHARPIGYGAMIGESLLALLAVMACTAGFGSSELWHEHYASWANVQGLVTKVDAFISGTVTFLGFLGVPSEYGFALIAMVVVSFALTTLDSATRLLRFNVEELAEAAGFRVPGGRYVSSAIAVGIIALFAFYEVDGKPAALALWALFGTTNQLLAGLTLGLVTLYLKQTGRPTAYTGIPAVFMMGSTSVAMVQNLMRYASADKSDPLLIGVGGALLLLGIWLTVEAALAARSLKFTRRAD